MKSLLSLTIFILGLICLTQHKSTSLQKDNLEDRLYNGLKEYMLTGYESADLKNAFKEAQAQFAFRDVDHFPRKPLICTLCNAAVRVLLDYQDMGASEQQVVDAVKELCTNTNIESKKVCGGVIELNAPIFLYIIKNKSDLTPDLVCGIIAQSANCPVPPREDDWTIEIPPPLAEEPTKVYNPKDDKPISILHLTDLHFDDEYTPGANAVCGESLCCGCGPDQGEPATPDAAAGNWGDYRSCDIPWYGVLDVMDQLEKHDFDYIYYTGDIINHRVWKTSIENNLRDLKRVYRQFRESFSSIPLFPILGNHEPNPLNEFAPSSINETDLTTQWLYDAMAEEWKDFLPESALQTIKKGGYYTTLVRPGFRVIGLNSNVGYIYNWWLLYDDKYLRNQLQWLVDTLYQAEKDGEKVHILSHIPSGDNTCYEKWGHEYHRIVQRFAHVISAQFVGHTHFDEMNVFYNNSNLDEPINVVFNGGSVTSFVNVNPNFVLYQVNSETLEVENYDQWIYNLPEANQNTLDVPPNWFKLYSFREAYSLESMKLPELGKLIKRLAVDPQLLDQYFRYKIREADLALEMGCDQECHEESLCNLVTTEFNGNKMCQDIISLYRESQNLE